MEQPNNSFTPLLDLDFVSTDELITDLRTVRLSRSIQKNTSVWNDILSILRDQCAHCGIDVEFFLSRDLIVTTQTLFRNTYFYLKPVGWPIEGILITHEIFSSCPEVWEIGKLLDEDPRPDELRAVNIDSASFNERLILNTFQEKIAGNSSITLEEFRSGFPKLHSVFKPWIDILDQRFKPDPEVSAKVGAKCIALMDCFNATKFNQKRVNLVRSLESEDKKKGLSWPLNFAMRVKDKGYFYDPVGDAGTALMSVGFLLVVPLLIVFAAQGPEFSWIVAIQTVLIVAIPLLMVFLAAKFDLKAIKLFSSIDSGWLKAITFGIVWFVLASVSAWLIFIFGKLVGVSSLPLNMDPIDLTGYLMALVMGWSLVYVFFMAIVGIILKPFAPLFLWCAKPFGIIVRLYFRLRPVALQSSIKKTFSVEHIDDSIKNAVDLMYGFSIDWYLSDVIAGVQRPTTDYEEIQRVFCYELIIR